MSDKMIQLGVIGLSADKQAWATMTHAVPLKGEPLNRYYDIKAIGTSSPETAKAAAKSFGIPEEKAYSKPEDMANDKDVDMVVVSVKVPLHHQLTLPALRAKKDVFVEWPLGATLTQAEELTVLAQKQGVKNIVGLQARQQAAVRKAKEIIGSGKLGRVVTTNVAISTSALYTMAAKNAYINDPNSGANIVSIPVAHTLDAVLFALGTEFAHLTASLHTNFPEMRIRNADGEGTHLMKNNLADSVTVAGVLKTGASASLTWNLTTPATPDLFSWTIAGEKASLKLESDNAAIQMAPDIKLFIYEPVVDPQVGRTDDSAYSMQKPSQWEPVEVPKAAYFGGVAAVYQAFAEGKTEGLVDFKGATRRHRMVDAIFRSAERGTRETYDS